MRFAVPPTLLLVGAALGESNYAPLFRYVVENGGGSHVAVGVSESGLRGLVTQRSCAPGDLLLEVPLSLCIADGADDDSAPLAGTAPKWSWSLPWNVQLALTVLEQQAAGGHNPFLDSWPQKPPPLPTSCDSSEHALASDPSLSTKADEAFFWLDEQYWLAKDAAEASELLRTFPDAEAFRSAMEFVWSRCLRLSSGPHGVRRLLVPLLDLANHEPVPSAMYAFGHSARVGPSIRLHAARALNVGDAVTITYGEHESTHFALYYGFVPEPNPHDALQVSLSDVLSTLPADQLEPEGGWASALEALAQADDESAEGGSSALASHMYDLKAVGPSTALIAMLSRLLPPPPSGSVEASACRAVASTVSAIENALWQYGADGAAESVGADEALLASDASDLSEVGDLLVRLRLSRKRLLMDLRTSMHELAALCDRDLDEGATRLAAACESADAPPPMYPALDELPVEELAAWEGRDWDWDAGAWA